MMASTGAIIRASGVLDRVPLGRILLIGVAPLLWIILRVNGLLFNISRVTWHHRRIFATVLPNDGPHALMKCHMGASSGIGPAKHKGKMMTRMDFSEGLKAYFDDMGEDVVRIAQAGMDVITVLILGTLIYLTSLDAASASLHGRPMFGVGASMAGVAGIALTSSHAPSSCGLTNDLLDVAHRSCIVALVLEPAEI